MKRQISKSEVDKAKKELKDATFRKICNGLSQKFDTKNFYNIFINNIDE